jgi:hypothetical protein
VPLQNRVDPFGEIHAVAARGSLMGNRGGPLHDASRRLGAARWRSPRWIYCRLAFRGRRRVPMSPGRYTELFFLDEATALAAGHRPCGECQRARLAEFRSCLADAGATLAEIDAALHAARRLRPPALLRDLPDGVMFTRAVQPRRAYLKLDGSIHAWSFAGYAPAPVPAAEEVLVLTPGPTAGAIAAGFRPSVALPAAPGRA